jgi:molybdopterin-binding protein
VVPIGWRRWKPKSSTASSRCPANHHNRNLFHPCLRNCAGLNNASLISTTGINIMTIKAINVRNQFKGSIKEIVLGDVLSEIDVQTASGIVTSVITTRSVKELELVVGSEVIAFVKSTEVSIAKL